MNFGTEEPRNRAFQGTSGFYALLREMRYCQYIELFEIAMAIFFTAYHYHPFHSEPIGLI